MLPPTQHTAFQAQASGADRLSRMPWFLRVLLPALMLCSFLTQSKFVPTIRNNIGAFEIVAMALVLYFVLFELRSNPVRFHPVVSVLFALVAAAFVSQVNIPFDRRYAGLLQTAILVGMAVVPLVLYNLSLRYRIGPAYLLKWLVTGALVVGPWIIIEGVSSGGDINVAGPFRNRAHMGAYMLSVFWMSLIYCLWPGLTTRQRLAGYGAVGLSLYAVAVSGRRSVYLSLILGLVGLGFAFVAAHRGKRLRMVATAGFAVAVLAGLYYYGSQVLPQAAFFQKRVGMIGERLKAATVSADDSATESFFVMQRHGVFRAFEDHPVVGIGWGGFTGSEYSPTGHEVHSTPLRFLAETGLIGITLYAALIFGLLLVATRIFAHMRRTPWGASYLALALGIWSLCISYLYNRHVTERTFWILVSVILISELSAGRWLLRKRRESAARAAPSPRPDRPRRLAPAALRIAGRG